MAYSKLREAKTLLPTVPEHHEAPRPPGQDDENLLAHELDYLNDADDDDDDADDDSDVSHYLNRSKHRPYRAWPRWLPLQWTAHRTASPSRRAKPRKRHALRTRILHIFVTRILQILATALYAAIALLMIVGIFFPSYSSPPEHYANLRKRALGIGGRVNEHNEKIFIVANLYDPEGGLVNGTWGNSVLKLIDLLGPENVFLSIYEDSPTVPAQAALDAFAARVPSQAALISDDLDRSTLQHYMTQSGEYHLGRIALLAEVRNRALRPLSDPTSAASSIAFDKLFFLNDIYFDPIDAANLILSTALNPSTGRTQYRAACALDFYDPVKFYDTYVTRDTDGYEMGLPFYPWFATAGSATSRHDVLSQTDAVRVKSCWGGMISFEAKWFQSSPNTSTSTSAPLRFRSSAAPYWDPSECCLIHADLADASASAEIYMNPYIRVAYHPVIYAWLPFARRFEHLYPLVHALFSPLAHRPAFNPRQAQVRGETVTDRVWVWDEPPPKGHWEDVVREADPAGFCGRYPFMFLLDHPKPGALPYVLERPPRDNGA